MRCAYGTLVLLLLAGCTKQKAETVPPVTSAKPSGMVAVGSEENLSASQADSLLKSNPAVQLIDVRTQSEWDRGYIAGAKLIPVDQIEARQGEIDKSRPVLLYCAAGGRSHRALEILKAAGYREVRHLSEGITGWKSAGLPLAK